MGREGSPEKTSWSWGDRGIIPAHVGSELVLAASSCCETGLPASPKGAQDTHESLRQLPTHRSGHGTKMSLRPVRGVLEPAGPATPGVRRGGMRVLEPGRDRPAQQGGTRSAPLTRASWGDCLLSGRTRGGAWPWLARNAPVRSGRRSWDRTKISECDMLGAGGRRMINGLARR